MNQSTNLQLALALAPSKPHAEAQSPLGMPCVLVSRAYSQGGRLRLRIDGCMYVCQGGRVRLRIGLTVTFQIGLTVRSKGEV